MYTYIDVSHKDLAYVSCHPTNQAPTADSHNLKTSCRTLLNEQEVVYDDGQVFVWIITGEYASFAALLISKTFKIWEKWQELILGQLDLTKDKSVLKLSCWQFTKPVIKLILI